MSAPALQCLAIGRLGLAITEEDQLTRLGNAELQPGGKRCEGGQRPCPFVGCRHHLYADVNLETGSIKINFPDREVWELEHSCSLDLADAGTHTLEEVGEILNVTRERTRQIEAAALAKLYEALDADLDMLDLVPGGAEDPTFPAAAE